MSNNSDIPNPVEITLSGRVYVLSPVPEQELGDVFPLMQHLVELDKRPYSFNANPILRAAAEQFILCALKPLYPDLPSNALWQVDGSELLHALDLALGLSGRLLTGIDLDEED